MKTLTPEQYRQKYGSQGAQFIQPQQTMGDILSKVGGTIKDSFNAGLEQGRQGVQEIGKQESNPLKAAGNLVEGVGRVGAGFLQSAFSPLAPATNLIGKGIEKYNEASGITDNPIFQNFAQSKAGQATSRVVENVGNYANIAGAVGGAMEVPKVTGAVETGLNKVKSGVESGLSTTKNAFDTVAENATKYPKQIADKVTMGKIESKVQTILKESPSNMFDEYVNVGQKAMKDPRELTPLEIAGQKGENVAKNIKQDLSNIGEQKSSALESVKNTRAPEIATKQIEKVKPFLQKKLTDPERGLVNEYLNELKSLGKNPTVKSVDATIDKLQATLYEKSKGVAVPMTTRIKSFINQSIGELNGELKTAVDTALGNDSYSKLNSLYADKIKTFTTLNKALGEGGTKGGSLMKRFFSPQDAGVKELFATIKKEYGVDLGQHATLAKFVMDTLGDTRAKSLLEMPPRTAAGLVGEVLKRVENKLTSPERIISKARTLTKP